MPLNKSLRAAKRVRRKAKEIPQGTSTEHTISKLHPFDSDPLDHAETELRAYRHVTPILKLLAKAFDLQPKQLQIWDPYFCKGAVVRHLAQLGFPRVFNVNQDFYKMVQEGNVPEHHVFMTNPPYSADHLPRCLEYCGRSMKPCLLLLPNWVAKKPYFSEQFARRMDDIFFVAPVHRYIYVMPPDLVPDSSKPSWVSDDGKTSPFLSSWYVILPKALTSANMYDRLESELKQFGPFDCILAKRLQAAKWKLKKVQEMRTAGPAQARKIKTDGKGKAVKTAAKVLRKHKSNPIPGTVEFN